MRNRTVAIIVGLLLLLTSAGVVASVAQPSPEELLADSLESLETIENGHAVISINVDVPENQMSGSVEVWGQKTTAPNDAPAIRVDVLETSTGDGVGMTLVGDGTTFWAYSPAENIVLTGTYDELAAIIQEQMDGHDGEHALPEDFELPDGFELPEDFTMPETADEAVALLLEYFDVERNGTDDIGGTRGFALRLIPIAEKMPDEIRAVGGLINVWIGTENRVPLQVEYTGGAVGEISISTSDVQINEGIDPSVFAFEIPTGAEVIHISDIEIPDHDGAAADASAAVELAPLAPAFIPEGAALVETVDIRGAVVQRYSLPDGKDFTVAQGAASAAPLPELGGEAVTVRGADATLFADTNAGRTLLAWSEDGIQYWIGGDLSADMALAIAESLD